MKYFVVIELDAENASEAISMGEGLLRYGKGGVDNSESARCVMLGTQVTLTPPARVWLWGREKEMRDDAESAG